MPVGCKESKAFQEIEDLLTRAPVMVYHRQGATARLTNDASPVGAGAILEQNKKTWPTGQYITLAGSLVKLKQDTPNLKEKL